MWGPRHSAYCAYWMIRPCSSWQTQVLVPVPWEVLLNVVNLVSYFSSLHNVHVPWNLLGDPSSLSKFLPSSLEALLGLAQRSDRSFYFQFLPSSLRVPWDLLNMVTSVPFDLNKMVNSVLCFSSYLSSFLVPLEFLGTPQHANSVPHFSSFGVPWDSLSMVNPVSCFSSSLVPWKFPVTCSSWWTPFLVLVPTQFLLSSLVLPQHGELSF